MILFSRRAHCCPPGIEIDVPLHSRGSMGPAPWLSGGGGVMSLTSDEGEEDHYTSLAGKCARAKFCCLIPLTWIESLNDNQVGDGSRVAEPNECE